MSRMNIHERVRASVRVVADAFGVSTVRVEQVVAKISERALEEAFGDDPTATIAAELADDLRDGIGRGLEKLHDGGTSSPVIDFPTGEARKS